MSPPTRPAVAPAPRRRSFGFRDDTGRLPISRLTVTILLTQLFGLTILMMGSFRVTQYRDGLIDAKLEAVRAQAQVIASIMATVAAEDADCDIVTADQDVAPCEVSLDRESVNAIFTRVWPSFEGRVRIFETPEDYDGGPISDPRAILLEDQVLRAGAIEAVELPDLTQGPADRLRTRLRQARGLFLDIFVDPGLRSTAQQRRLEDELTRAFRSTGINAQRGAASLRYNEDNELVASVSVPIRKVQAIYGVVTAEIGGIDEVLSSARAALLSFSLVALIVAVILSILLTMNIATPIRRLARAADSVRVGLRGSSRRRIPEFPNRRDDIGELARSLKSMTAALYDRIEAIEHFAADVSHELKNPLTSIRSAIETLDIAKTEQARARLLAVIKQDVARMDRLITDISNASRLDAELAREKRDIVDLRQLLRDVVATYTSRDDQGDRPKIHIEKEPADPAYLIGSPGTLGQVLRNLMDNALSFSPEGGAVRISLVVEAREGGQLAILSVEDEGPGIPEENLESIFERFYTKRPEGAQFGNNSGLGLAISRQIVESHDGNIWAENRRGDGAGPPRGARFTVLLPLLSTDR
ncbi:sensor histidine kinase [Parvularcula bermudensis HTCC2503]|uniref:histidine kinase n=1 Tax=Parvularcula bermudensis (strain ATCC BAA-594 / HTCC2503 / KCTC 12087) TaxID=314260 RepID=E0TE51_PARBH|nr:ATP-binding protein [Parvularcula bermudensis]ADM08872.1 sensor histidine kinase [Parvularcula bermudensis HTCC2503]